jgi:hypothetical protein
VSPPRIRAQRADGRFFDILLGAENEYDLYVKHDICLYYKYEKYDSFERQNRRFVPLSPTGTDGYV